ncbi:hypothetical protein VB735_07360 [Halotia wernerae UHCC 0503]|nr:hypothetical protein [Halotia wernerae UHCC 0503]
MLKPLLLSGWFRVQPFLNYVVVVMLIAPLIAASGHSTSAKQLKAVAKNTPETGDSDSIPQEVATVSQPDLTEILKPSEVYSRSEESDSARLAMDGVGEMPILQDDKIESLVVEDYSVSSSNLATADTLAAVELAPIPEMPVNKLKAAKIQSLTGENNSLSREVPVTKSLAAVHVAPIAPILTESQPNSTTEAPVTEQPDEEQAVQVDPIGSPHPIPWRWIVATQETIGAKGSSGVRYYRSVPVISPDGKYAVYSRVQMEVKPEMYNSRVTSVLFVEDQQTKKLRVMASTSSINDPLLTTNVSLSEQDEKNGKIGVLVPVSWSEKSDRFLARKFEGVFNTGDATDQAVIWDRQKDHANTVAPSQEKDGHEKIAVLLGWSKNQPDHVLFRAGEMGEENWPLVQVGTDGKTMNTTDTDQPITFGQKVTEVWAGPQVASR